MWPLRERYLKVHYSIPWMPKYQLFSPPTLWRFVENVSRCSNQVMNWTGVVICKCHFIQTLSHTRLKVWSEKSGVPQISKSNNGTCCLCKNNMSQLRKYSCLLLSASKGNEYLGTKRSFAFYWVRGLKTQHTPDASWFEFANATIFLLQSVLPSLSINNWFNHSARLCVFPVNEKSPGLTV